MWFVSGILPGLRGGKKLVIKVGNALQKVWGGVFELGIENE